MTTAPFRLFAGRCSTAPYKQRGTATLSPILLCAATRWEAAPLTRRLGRDSRARLLKTGMGPQKAAHALSGVADAKDYKYVISTGFAGALQEGMRSGDLVLDVRGADSELPASAREIAARQNVKIHFGKIAHSDEVLTTPESKKALGQSQRASAVDMETSAIKNWAETRGLNVIAVRVILDELSDHLPENLPESEGNFDLARYALTHLNAVPLLAALGIKQRKAIGTLAAFLEEFLKVL